MSLKTDFWNEITFPADWIAHNGDHPYTPSLGFTRADQTKPRKFIDLGETTGELHRLW